MNTIFKINNLKLAFLAILFVSLSSCDKVGDEDAGGTSTQNMAGDWYVQLLINDADVYGIGYYQLTTYNTATNDGTQIWVDDHGLWPMKVKASVDYGSLTFSGANLENEYSYTSGGVQVFPMTNISNGKIVPGGATTIGGNTSDLIEFEVEYDDDPGTVYTIRGYKRTGFPEDEP